MTSRSLLPLVLALSACAPVGHPARVGGHPPPGPAAPAAVAPLRPDLRAELVTMGAADQEARSGSDRLFRPDGTLDTALVRRSMARTDSVDALNRARLKAMIAENGWPTPRLVGPEGAEAAFLIVQHSTGDPAFQREYLVYLEGAFRRGEAAGQDVALLTDRVRQGEGKLQLYGTQATITDGGLVVDPIENPAELDRRRASLGLPPHAAYLRVLREAYGLPPG